MGGDLRSSLLGAAHLVALTTQSKRSEHKRNRDCIGGVVGQVAEKAAFGVLCHSSQSFIKIMEFILIPRVIFQPI